MTMTTELFEGVGWFCDFFEIVLTGRSKSQVRILSLKKISQELTQRNIAIA